LTFYFREELIMMSLAIRGDHMDITQALQDYVERKIGRVQSWFQEECRTTVRLSVEGKTNRHAVEVTVQVNGVIIRAEDRSEDMYASVDRIMDKLERQIRKHMGKIRGRGRQASRKDRVELNSIFLNKEENAPFQIDKVKQIVLKPSDREEAILHMNLLDHDFHVLLNRDTGKTEVVYRRRNGTYGVITN
jgi:putative sigma-54 modulation protein